MNELCLGFEYSSASQELKSNFIKAFVVTFNGSKKIPKDLRLHKMIIFYSKVRVEGHGYVVCQIFMKLSEDEQNAFLKAVIENIVVDEFVLPEQLFMSKPERFLDFFSDYLEALFVVYKENLQLPKPKIFEVAPVLLGLDVLDRFGHHLRLANALIIYYVYVPKNKVLPKTLSQFLKMLPNWTRYEEGNQESRIHSLINSYNLSLENYAIVVRNRSVCIRNASIEEVIDSYQQQINLLFQFARGIKIDVNETSTKVLEGVAKHVKILANWEKGLNLLDFQERKELLELVQGPLVEICNSSNKYMIWIAFYGLCFVFRVKSVEDFDSSKDSFSLDF